MKKYLFTLLIILFVSLTTFAQKFWEQSTLSAGFDVTKSYKVAILPVFSGNIELTGNKNIFDAVYNKINLELTASSKFQVLPKFAVEQAVNKFRYGSSVTIDPSKYNDLAKELKVDLLVICELSNDKQMIKKKEIGTVMAYIQVFNMKNEALVAYSGKARAINPISAEAEAEFAAQKALRVLMDKMK